MLNNMRNKHKILYTVSSALLLVLATILVFGYSEIPLFSSWRNNSLEVKETENEKSLEEDNPQTEDDVLGEDISEDSEYNQQEDNTVAPSAPANVQKKSENLNTVTPPTTEQAPQPETTPSPLPIQPKCTDDKIASLQDNIDWVTRSKQYVDNYVVITGTIGDMGTSSTIWSDLRNANLYTNTRISEIMSYYGNLLNKVKQEGGASGAWRTGAFYKQLADIQNEWLRELSKEYSNELNRLYADLRECEI